MQKRRIVTIIYPQSISEIEGMQACSSILSNKNSMFYIRTILLIYYKFLLLFLPNHIRSSRKRALLNTLLRFQILVFDCYHTLSLP